MWWLQLGAQPGDGRELVAVRRAAGQLQRRGPRTAAVGGGAGHGGAAAPRRRRRPRIRALVARRHQALLRYLLYCIQVMYNVAVLRS